MRPYIITLTLVSFLFAGITQVVAQGGAGGGGASAGGAAGTSTSSGSGSNGTGSQGQTGVPTKNSSTFSNPLNGANTNPPLQNYNSTTGVGTAPNGAPVGSPGSGPGSPQQPYDSGAGTQK
jgi:hypothetical protein